MVVMFFSKDLKNSKQELEKQHKALEVEYKELKRLSISVESVSISTSLEILAFKMCLSTILCVTAGSEIVCFVFPGTGFIATDRKRYFRSDE